MSFARKSALFLIAAAAPAVAAQADEASDRVLAPFAACHALPDPAQRGLCYDRAYDGIRAGLASGDVVISDAQRRHARFGLPSESLKRSSSSGHTAPVPIGQNEIDSTIVATRPYGVDMIVIQLADGSLWRTAEGGPDPHFRPGTKVHLKRVLLGGIMLQAANGHQMKVVRIR